MELPEVRETRVGAYGICLREGSLLLIHKAKGPYTGQLDLPGGGIEFGEAPEETVVREFLEETGLAVEVLNLAGTFSKVSRWVNEAGTARIEGHHLGFFYRVAEADPGAAIKRDPDGLDSLGAVWAPLNSLTPETASPLVMRALSLMDETETDR